MSFNKITLNDVTVTGKRVLIRVDFNVPIKNGVITDDTRIKAALPTIKHIISNGGRLILVSHLGRPDGEQNLEFSLQPVAKHLQGLLNQPVQFLPDCIGSKTKECALNLKNGEVALLENVRFCPEEELLNKYAKQNQETKNKIDAFVKELSELGEIYVNDAFGTAHRAHASTAGVTKYFNQNICGFLMEKELRYLGGALENPERPFVAILGGAKVSDKIGVIQSLLSKVDTLIIGGAMAYTFLKALNLPIGTSLVEDEQLELALSLVSQAKDKGIKLLLPTDHAIASSFAASEPSEIADRIPDGMMALDIGPKSIALFESALANAKTVIWNGPMGVFEKPGFAKGTFAIAHTLAKLSATTIVGGGDSVAAINQSGEADKITHISTGGGASLELLEGKELPGVVALTDRKTN
jgi:phosphoglycerate kinase